MTTIWNKYIVPFDSILINNSCKYFLHLQLFSEYEDVLNELWSYMKKKKLSDDKFKPFENTVSNKVIADLDGADSKNSPTFKLFKNVKEHRNAYALIIWKEIYSDNNREQLVTFLSEYFAMGDTQLKPMPYSSDMSEDVYGKNILKQYIHDMISIYKKKKNKNKKNNIKKKK